MAASGLTLDLVLDLPDHESVDSVAAQARRAEDRGFDLVTTGETTGWNVVPVLAVVADRTESITVADDVLSPYSRAPTTVGQTALAMHDVADGRFRLGLGTSSPALAERWHGQAFDRPLRRLRETIDVVREVYAGGRVEYEGEIFEVGGLGYEREVPADPPAIDVAALGPKATELAGRFADGWVPQLFTPEGLRDRLTDFRRGVDLADAEDGSDRDRRVSPLIRCCAHEDREYARSLGRQTVAFLVGAYGPFYGQSVAEQGYEDVVAEIRAAWNDGRDTDRMAAALPDDLLDDLAAVGTPDEVRSQFERFAAIDGVDAVRTGFVDGMSQADKVETLDALAPLT
ncbi:TIGR04024 family LLM class F420-dependent oxidoreductase [Halobacteriales archaeon Cl-PHB]